MDNLMAKLALEDGSVYEGRSFGASGEICGEVVFNTSMTGYQEVLTDPSYRGQIVTMTYPLIGNYGVNAEDQESQKPQVEGFIVRELTPQPSNFRAKQDLPKYLLDNNIIGIEGIDTRALVRRLRLRGTIRGILSTQDLDNSSLVIKARQSPGIIGRDLVREVTPKKQFDWAEGVTSSFGSQLIPSTPPACRVVAVDYGMKWNILRCLVQVGCQVTVVPGTTSAKEILGLNPDGIFLSNGPGDPSAVGYAINTIKDLLGKKPLFGICLGHQLLNLALGAKTYKMKFGHRGANQPVINHGTGKVEITVQNHGFAVDPSTVNNEVEITHTNLNDQTNEGIRHKKYPAFSVQYHPESSAGPHDSSYLFMEFRKLIG